MPEYVDENGNRSWTHIVYVVELKPAACAEAGSPCGGTKCGRVPVYVGQTAKTAQERLEQHKRGDHASKWVKLYWLHLRPRLAYPKTEMTRAEALVAERELGKRLQKKGFCVYGAH
jgi:predicted GIY-YIG superfamily endonuclease